MRILLVSHRFPPQHSAGTEVYTAELGVRLAALGHEVRVLTTDKDVSAPDLEFVEREHAGLAVSELRNNLLYEHFAESWQHPGIEERFAALLDRLRPAVVHFHHLMFLSAGCLRIAREKGAAVVFTLHDFWLQCPRHGQLVHGDGSICHKIEFERCGSCLPTFAWAQSPAQRRVARVLSGLRRGTRIDLGPAARGLAAWAGRNRRQRAEGGPQVPAAAVVREYADLAHERSDAVRELAVRHVQHFIAPSRFLAQRFIEWGLPEERMHHLATGIDSAAFPASAAQGSAAREPGAPLRIAFLGTLVPIKGADVLVAAWARLDEDQRRRSELRLYGPQGFDTSWCAQLRQRADEVGVELMGALSREEVPTALARTDLLVVPSIWYENRPLVIIEALAMRTPLLVSDLGGMAELVHPGENGWRFPVGDSDALARRLAALIADPAPLAALYERPPELPTWESLVAGTLDLYERALAEG